MNQDELLAKIYVKPHNKVSRVVTQNDVEKVVQDAEKMYSLLFLPIGFCSTVPHHGLAHPQVNSIDPLRFFVTQKEVVINPKIIRQTNYKIRKYEGCLSFYDRPGTEVMRSHKIEVEYQTIEDDDTLSPVKHLILTGLDAEIWQHEVDHLNGVCIYVLQPEESRIIKL